jgi:hypothetical protein
MKFKFTFYSNINTALFQELCNVLDAFLSDKNYGDDILNYHIGIICADPKFDQFFKPRRPKYIEEKKATTRDGIKYEVKKTLGYDIKFDYEFYLKMDDESAKRHILAKILDSIIEIKKIKSINKLDFNFELFFSDLKGFADSNGLL